MSLLPGVVVSICSVMLTNSMPRPWRPLRNSIRCGSERPARSNFHKPCSKRDIAAPLAKHPSASSRARRQGYGRDSRKRKCSREDRVKNSTPPYTLNEREHLRLVTRLRIWGRSSASFAREWDRGGRARLVTPACDTRPGAVRTLALRLFERLLPIHSQEALRSFLSRRCS